MGPLKKINYALFLVLPSIILIVLYLFVLANDYTNINNSFIPAAVPQESIPSFKVEEVAVEMNQVDENSPLDRGGRP